MLIRAISQWVSTGSFLPVVTALLSSIFVVFYVIPIHEAAHAWAAYKMGDDTPKYAGGLTLNPMAHIDPLGAIMLILVGVGWGKPTPINPYNFRDEKKGRIVTALAGPVSNLLLGWLFIFLSNLIAHIGNPLNSFVIAMVAFFYLSGNISTWLGVLNLLQVPLFDGFTLIEVFLSPKAKYWIQQNQRIISIVILILLFTNILIYPLEFISNFFMRFFQWTSNLIFA